MLLAAVQAAGLLAAQESVDLQPAPTPELQMEIDRVSREGRSLFVVWDLLRRAEKALAAELGGGELEGLEGSIIGVHQKNMRIRFVGESEAGLVALADVGIEPGSEGVATVVLHDAPVRLGAREEASFRGQQTALAANPHKCDFDYEAIPAPSAADGSLNFYLFGASRDGEGIVLAGHSRITVSADGTEVREVQPLSNTCLVVGAPPSEVPPQEAFVMVTHLLSEAPTTAHVFTSLRARVPVIVGTEAGVWLLFGGRIGFLGKPSEPLDEAVCDELLEGVFSRGGSPEDAHWRQRLVLGHMQASLDPPWRSDARLERFFAPGYPDDVQVGFINHDELSKSEMMWVRLIAHEPELDLYLGTLLNQPFNLKTPRQGENVVMRFSAENGFPMAIDLDGDYSRPGRPDATLEGLGAAVYEGLRQLRLSANGNAPEPLAECRSLLTEALAEAGEEADPELLFQGHYVLGRCLAEVYETDLAIEHFRQATKLDPDDPNAAMALLAEYSVKVHEEAAEGEGVPSAWEEPFFEHLERVREDFSDRLAVRGTLEMIFDEEKIKSLTELTPEQIERGRKFGFGVIRWKFP